jgi:hypothetical protein
LLSVTQLCEIGYKCLFTDKSVTIFRRSDGSFAFKGVLRGTNKYYNEEPSQTLKRWPHSWINKYFFLTKIGLAELAKLENKLEPIIMPRTS